MTELFQAISTRLLNQVPALKKVERWNGQLNRQASEKPIHPPLVYLELVNVRAQTVGPGRQHCEAVLRVRLVCKAIDPDANAVLAEEVYVALQAFSAAPLLVALDRRTLAQDVNHDALEQLIQEFACKWVDLAKKPIMVKPAATLEIGQ